MVTLNPNKPFSLLACADRFDKKLLDKTDHPVQALVIYNESIQRFVFDLWPPLFPLPRHCLSSQQGAERYLWSQDLCKRKADLMANESCELAR
jgi:hypothetical protein